MNQNDNNTDLDNKLFGLMDLINSKNEENNSNQKLNIPDYSMNSNSKDMVETLDYEDDSKQSLNPKNNDLLDINDSGIIQIPNKYPEEKLQSISSDENILDSTDNEYSTPLTSKSNTLEESISTTLLRDLQLIYYKLKHVINPFTNNSDRQRHIMQWDLWGPLLFITFLSCTLAIKAENKSKIIVILFAFFLVR